MRRREVEAVDGTAAGDAFAACLIVSLLEGRAARGGAAPRCAAGALAASRLGRAAVAADGRRGRRDTRALMADRRSCSTAIPGTTTRSRCCSRSPRRRSSSWGSRLSLETRRSRRRRRTLYASSSSPAARTSPLRPAPTGRSCGSATSRRTSTATGLVGPDFPAAGRTRREHAVDLIASGSAPAWSRLTLVPTGPHEHRAPARAPPRRRPAPPVAALVRDPPARGRRRSADDPGAARALVAVDDADLQPRRRAPAPPCLRLVPSAVVKRITGGRGEPVPGRDEPPRP